MADYFLGEIRLFPYDRVPKGWSRCEGQTLPINQNQALYSLLGTMYGGDGRTSFALPDLRGRTPIQHDNAQYRQGMAGGTETVTLSSAEMPAHTHAVGASTSDATSSDPSNAIPANMTLEGPLASAALYAASAPTVAMSPTIVQASGGGEAHENRQPYLALVFCISVTGGIYPPHN